MRSNLDSSTFFAPLRSVLRARKWIIILSAIVLPAVAVGVSVREKPLYQSSAQILLSRNDLADTLTNTPNPQSSEFDFNRIVQTEAQLAATPAVVRQVIAAAHVPGMTAKQFLAESVVLTSPNDNIMTLRVTAGTPELARRLTNAYANEFVAYSQNQNGQLLLKAAADLTAQLKTLPPASAAYAQDLSELQRVENLESLGNSTVSVVQPATGAIQTQPQTARSLILGIVLGLVIGVVLAFVFDRLDTRIRSSEEIQRRLGVSLLARVPAPPRKLRKRDQIVMLADPTGRDAENFRALRTNVMFADIDHQAHTIMVTSAIEVEGKSTTIANLAVALARGGQRVILADLDLRRPTLERYFDLPEAPGLTSVLLGHTRLVNALIEVPLPEAPGFLKPELNGGGGEALLRAEGSLRVLPTGDLPPNAGELIASAALRKIVASLGLLADVVLIDAPPLLPVSDAMTLSSEVDAIIVVARLGVVRRPMLDELTRQLAASPATVLGVVVTNAASDGGHGYGYGYYYSKNGKTGRSAARRKRPVRAREDVVADSPRAPVR